MDYVEVKDPDSSHTPGQGHSYFEVEEQAARLVAQWLEEKSFLPQ